MTVDNVFHAIKAPSIDEGRSLATLIRCFPFSFLFLSSRRLFLFRSQAAYHCVRDSYQFTAELRKVLHSLTPRAARAACLALRNTPLAINATRTVGVKRGRSDESAALPAERSAADVGTLREENDDDEMPYMTQVRRE